ncbi:Glucose 1-dehydrogenase 2 [Polystyrenella longa]|uniref:Glucose 1-dehydrogenase 2 n=1 Tax=Polystyrenella longa TaxID=2528007 RepID=A0A518CRQ9_9PLAN|nr:SDR family oxidoreductase [Polystyrenella longa]QDU81884.1 Glucose 1-dehydrogenase 2 [Polystyrenella longa]
MTLFDRFRLDGKRLFITGGSRGLGREMALAIAEAGADVIFTGRDEASLQKTANELEALGRQAFPIQADFSTPDTCEEVCERVLGDYGPVDILINNIGGRRISVPIETQSLAEWQQILDLNVTSTFLCTRIIGGAMLDRETGGRVINIASISGLVTTPDIGGRSYETSKGAIIQFTKAVATDWATRRVTVNAICPGTFMTEPNLRWAREKPELIEKMKSQIPMQQFGEPSDLGPLAVYLASDAARYMTGATMVLDGGATLV